MKTIFKLNFFMVILILLISISTLHAEEVKKEISQGWQRTLVFDFTTTQNAYSDSWTGGESGAVNWVANLNGTAEKQFSEKFNLRSILKLSFGQTLIQDADTKNWEKPKKSTDLIDWENLARFTLNQLVDPYAAFRIESQFLDASVDAKKRYLSPLRLTESVGFAKQIYKNEEQQIISRLGVAFRQNITKVITDLETLATENMTSNDGGIESVTDVILKVNERLSYTGKLTLFKALYNSEKDKIAETVTADFWKAIDVNWENTINAQITKIVTVRFYTQLLYDKEISKKGRIKETLGIGFIFNLM